MCDKNKCVFKIKHNGVYWARLVAGRYSQGTNIDFSEKYSLVVNNTTFSILLLMVLHFGYLVKIVDVETTFSMGTSKKKFICNVPKACLI